MEMHTNINDPIIQAKMYDLAAKNKQSDQKNIIEDSWLDNLNSSYWGTVFNYSSICGFGPWIFTLP